MRSSFLVYPLVSAAHLLCLGAALATVLLIDAKLLAPGWMTGRALGEAALRRLALAAFAGAVVTGFALFSVKATEYAATAAFQVKLALILAAGVNLALFSAGMARPPIHAALSAALWIGVLVAGRFIGFA